MTFGAWRFIGPSDNSASAPAPVVIVANWLTGRQESIKSLGKQDKLIKGGPVLITEPGKAGIFRWKLKVPCYVPPH